jgi:hypothetical protein
LALHRHDAVFVLLQLSTLISALIILFLVHRYRGMVCAAHALAFGHTTVPGQVGADVGRTHL